ncbi:MAG TPA: antitoxin Xre/MbcA/ParS toxin-binding domain-containing protein [Longimicrobium sp.]|jgi:nucleoid DNA-binding protein|uniref:antitoxin Xre/MbcA/ParS toxin-binding domain-containing protein n=1 Tax=Longimicrobium sp. TaxID=2029185 RepID=UPI002ED81A42
MTRTEFASQVAQKASITPAEAARVIDAVFDSQSGAIPEALDFDGKITIAGFGTFTRKPGRSRRVPEGAGDVEFKSADGSLVFLSPGHIAPAVAPLSLGKVQSGTGAVATRDSRTLSAADEIRRMALDTWENAHDAEEFLTTPHPLLDGQTPLDVCGTDSGAQRVREILIALEYGLPV